jgi:hypothetical protein
MAKDTQLPGLEKFERQQREFQAWRKAAEMDDEAQTDLVVSAFGILPKSASLSRRIVEVSQRMRELWGDLVDPRLFIAVLDLPSEYADVDEAHMEAVFQVFESGGPVTEAQVAMVAHFVAVVKGARQGDGSTEEKMELQRDWIALVVECRKLIV